VLSGTLPALVLVLGLVIVCAGGYRWLASRAGGLAGQLAGTGAPAGIIDVLGRYPLGRGQSLLLLRVAGRVLLVAQAAGGRVGAAATMQTLCEIDDPVEVASIVGRTASAPGGFREVIARLERGEGAAPSARHEHGGIEVVDLTARSRGALGLGSLGLGSRGQGSRGQGSLGLLGHLTGRRP
jgi:flagellar biogenesis protein FliO